MLVFECVHRSPESLVPKSHQATSIDEPIKWLKHPLLSSRIYSKISLRTLCRRGRTPLSAMVSAKAITTLFQMVDALHRWKRQKIEFQLQFFSEMPRHGAQLRSRHRMPLIPFRLTSGGRPCPNFAGIRSTGNKTVKIRHSTSVRSPRLKAASSNLQH
jgi:hypothetical protein